MNRKTSVFNFPTTLSEAIYQHLKNAIVQGEFKPGQRLQEKEIASLYNASSTPVREAFFRLAAEKYIVMNARREVLVTRTSDRSAQELYAIVRVLDKLAVEGALKRIGPEDIDGLREMTRRLEDHYRRKKNQDYLDQNLAIHDKIWQLCGNAFLYELISEVMAKIAIYRQHVGLAPFSDAWALEKSIRDHLRLAELIEARDLKALFELIETHWGEEFIKGDEADTESGRPIGEEIKDGGYAENNKGLTGNSSSHSRR